MQIKLLKDKDYLLWINEIKEKINRLQIKAAIAVNHEMLAFYWDLGKGIVYKCKFWCKTDTHSDLMRTGIPDKGGHPFRFKTDTHSGSKRTVVPF